MSRQNWAEYFMSIAETVSARSTCPRRAVGSVLVSSEKMVLSTGYNGAIRGAAHCSDTGCKVEHEHCVSVVHSELNAIIQAAKNGTKIDGAILYCTMYPCFSCFKAIANSGISEVVYKELYKPDPRIAGLAIGSQIYVRQLK